MIDKTCEKNQFETVASVTRAHQNVKTCNESSQKCWDREQTFWKLQDLHTCTENKIAESWDCEVCQWADRASSHRFLRLILTW